mmetsp:Transcript_51796/g.77305  ORF Transcript_51796/g.77305 Transcript_51796/m.77305 type:complete len:99 (-) Transcript_51796:2077-2373(-)
MTKTANFPTSRSAGAAVDPKALKDEVAGFAVKSSAGSCSKNQANPVQEQTENVVGGETPSAAIVVVAVPLPWSWDEEARDVGDDDDEEGAWAVVQSRC